MRWLRALATDLRQPEAPTDRRELLFLTASALTVVAAAQLSEPGTVGELAVLAVPVAAFVARARVPALPSEVFAALVVVPVAGVVGQRGNLEVAQFLSVIAVLYTAWHLGSLVRSAAIAAVVAASPWLAATFLPAPGGLQWSPWTAACVFTFVLGRTLLRQRMLIEELEAARQGLAEAAVTEERRRMARELHDLAGHTLAAVLLHVTGARHVLRRDLDEAERALRDAEAVGRSSLDVVRATVASLRTSERGTDPPLAGSGDLTALAEEYRRAGLDVTVVIAPAVVGVDGPVGTALHRIAREALANVARHAPGNRVDVVAAAEGDAIELTVSDHGRPAGPPDAAAGHFGLVGMRERARSLGGELDAGPSPDGWSVRARLPRTAPGDGR